MQIINKYNRILVFSIGIIFFSFFFYLSWIYYKERMLSFDPSFFSFLMIDGHDFSFALGRWGTALTQFIPLIALKNGCTLQTFLQLYSISPTVIYALVFGIIFIVLKNNKAALALILSLCIGFRHAFYYTTAELYIGIALTILLWAIISPEKEYGSKIKKQSALILSLALIYVMSYLHQLTIFLIMFVLITELLANNKMKDKSLWILIISTTIWFALRIFLFTNSEYESEKIPALNVFIEKIPNLRYLPSTVHFKYFALYELWPVFLIFLISWIFIFRNKQWLYFIFLPCYSITFLIIILITYHKGDSPLMYENYYTVLGVFAAIVFLFVLTKNKISNTWIIAVITPLVIFSSIEISNAHTILTKRINYIDRMVNYGRKQENKKFLINDKNFPWQYGWVNWALPFETTLYSAIDGRDNVVTFFSTDNMNKYDTLINNENIFLGPNWAVTWFGSNNLDSSYFNFPSSGYKKLNTSQADSSFNEKIFNKNNIQIVPLKPTYFSDVDSFIVAPILIKNGSGKTLASIPDGDHPIYLNYHVYNKKGEPIIFDGRKTPLDVDIVDSYIQGLVVTLPKEKGEYTIAVDFVTEKKRWWGINSKFVLVVN